MGELCVMDREAGDIRISWDPKNSDEVASIKDQFERLKKKGYLFFKVGEEKPSPYDTKLGEAIFAKTTPQKTEKIDKVKGDEKKIVAMPMPAGG